MFVPHLGPVELAAVLLMTLVTGIVWLTDKRRRRGRRALDGPLARIHRR